MASAEPLQASAKDPTSVAGGQIMTSTAAAPGADGSASRTLMASARDVLSPFIFQLPATRGRMVRSIVISWTRQRSRGQTPGRFVGNVASAPDQGSDPRFHPEPGRLAFAGEASYHSRAGMPAPGSDPRPNAGGRPWSS